MPAYHDPAVVTRDLRQVEKRLGRQSGHPRGTGQAEASGHTEPQASGRLLWELLAEPLV